MRIRATPFDHGRFWTKSVTTRRCSLLTYSCFFAVVLATVGTPGLGVSSLFAGQSEDRRNGLPRDDNQIWTDYQYSFPTGRRIEGIVSGTLRLGRGMEHLVHERAGAAVSIKAGKHWSFSPGYSYIATQPLRGIDTRENRIHFEVGFQAALWNFLLTDRNRIERRMFPRVDYFRYRNRLAIEHPLEAGHLRLRVFVYDEFFYDGLLEKWSRNRIAVGVTRRMAKFLSMDFFYLRQNDHYSRPGYIHALGLGFKFRS
jgi:Protein of unknown function (DUF2490)